MTGQHILITGGAGFIGSHLAERLLKEGHAVSIIDDLSTGQMDNIAHLQGTPGFQAVFESILNLSALDRLVAEASTVFHLAATVGVKLIVQQPVKTLRTNVMGTEAVLNAVRQYGAKIVLASTSEVYGKGNKVPFAENDDVVLGPTVINRWGYGASKMLDEFLALAYHGEFGLEVIIPRLFNTIGSRQIGEYGMVVPRFIAQAVAGEPLAVYGDGAQTRCFLHVSDTVEALLRLMMSPDAVGQVVNIGSTNEISILALAQRILELTHRLGLRQQPSDEDIRFMSYENAYRPGFEDMQRRVPDIRKAGSMIGWSPQVSLDQALLELIQLHLKQDRLGPVG